MRRGETCGAVTGAFMVLGLAFSPGDCSTKEGRNRVYAAVSTFSEQFKARNNTLGCKELLGCDINTEDGLKHAFENKLFQTRCAKFVQDTVEILEEMTGSKKPSFGSGAQA
jgi:C_GCAxxG_C_C family probable redox protein